MLFVNKKEVNYELYFKSDIIKVLSNKQNFTNKWCCDMINKVKVFFWFKGVKEDDLDFYKLFNHLILIWLITGQRAKIMKLGSVLNKGIRYYRYKFNVNIKNIYIFFNFLNEILRSIAQKGSKRMHFERLDEILYSYRDFGSFTNMRLSNNFYLNSVHDPLYMKIIKIKKSNLNLSYYVESLKI